MPIASKRYASSFFGLIDRARYIHNCNLLRHLWPNTLCPNLFVFLCAKLLHPPRPSFASWSRLIVFQSLHFSIPPTIFSSPSKSITLLVPPCIVPFVDQSTLLKLSSIYALRSIACLTFASAGSSRTTQITITLPAFCFRATMHALLFRPVAGMTIYFSTLLHLCHPMCLRRGTHLHKLAPKTRRPIRQHQRLRDDLRRPHNLLS